MFKALGEGRFAKDPVVKSVGKSQVVEFRLAMNEYRKSKETGESVKTTNFFDFEVWDSAADIIAKNCQKGTRILVEAKPRHEQWRDKEENYRSRVFFRVEEFTILDKRKEGQADEANEEVTATPAETSPF